MNNKQMCDKFFCLFCILVFWKTMLMPMVSDAASHKKKRNTLVATFFMEHRHRKLQRVFFHPAFPIKKND